MWGGGAGDANVGPGGNCGGGSGPNLSPGGAGQAITVSRALPPVLDASCQVRAGRVGLVLVGGVGSLGVGYPRV